MLYKGIGKEISGERKDEEWKSIYDVGWREQGWVNFGEEKKLSC
jgi:hypothetical protein